ncbi:MAG: chemotaxis protein CheA [Bdellovibrionales bacterium]
MSSPVDLKEFVAGFIVEAEEYLHTINRNLVTVSESIKKGKPEPRAIRELFRSLHTIKGLASMVGAEPIVDLSHEMEGLLRVADRAGGRLAEPFLDLLLQGTRAIEERVRVVSKSGVAATPAAPPELLDELALAQSHAHSSQSSAMELALPGEIQRTLSASEREQMVQARQSGRKIVLLEFQPSVERADAGLNITSLRERLGKCGDLVKVIPRSSPTAPTGISFVLLLITDADNERLSLASGLPLDGIMDVEPAPGPAPGPAPDRHSDAGADASFDPSRPLNDLEEWVPSGEASVRVDIRRLDEVLEQLSGLVVTRSKLTRVAADLYARGVDTRELNAVITENVRQLRRLRASVMKARMVPLSELLQRLPLVVRGLTKDTGKSVNVVVHGGSAEVDKAVADKIFPAIIHLVRNAVDHAIEPRLERRSVGKPEAGTLQILSDDSSGTNLVLTVKDDGRGIDRISVARRAGLEEARSEDELLQQIAIPGLSTKEGATHTSGRGMGVDIVKRTVESLGGVLSLSTEKGHGTSFTLRVPVSVTILDVFSFTSGDHVFATPVAMVDEIIEVNGKKLATSPAPEQKGPTLRLIERRGESIPFVCLQAVLEKKTGNMESPKALVVNQHRGAFAFGVDRILGQQEVVLRPVDHNLLHVSGLAGATDLGDGKPTLVLDLASLGAAMNQNSVAES